MLIPDMAHLSRRHVLFGLSCLILAGLFISPILALAKLALEDGRYTVTIAIPPVVIALIWFDRAAIFRAVQLQLRAGSILMLSGVIVLAISRMRFATQGILSGEILALVLLAIGIFVCFYGTRAVRAAIFPLGLLFLIVPLPAPVVERGVIGLQRASAETAYRIFKLLRIPVFREGAVKLALPGVTIEVAEECSGIRSTLSLFIASLVAGRILLRSGWSRLAFSLMTIPIGIIKNALRIITISWLSVYVDSSFLFGRFHKNSGIPFSLVAMALLAPMLVLLMRAEHLRVRESREPRAIGPN